MKHIIRPRYHGFCNNWHFYTGSQAAARSRRSTILLLRADDRMHTSTAGFIVFPLAAGRDNATNTTPEITKQPSTSDLPLQAGLRFTANTPPWVFQQDRCPSRACQDSVAGPGAVTTVSLAVNRLTDNAGQAGDNSSLETWLMIRSDMADSLLTLTSMIEAASLCIMRELALAVIIY
jgi:hypothetical protein